MERGEVIKSIEKQKKRAVENIFFKQYSELLNYQLMEGEFEDCGDEYLEVIHSVYQQKLKYQKQKAKSRYYMVTVNTSVVEYPTLDMVRNSNLIKQVEKYVKRSFVKNYTYTYEYHTQKGNHLHVHILVDTLGSISDWKFKENTKSTFSKVVNLDIKNPRQLHISAINPKNLMDKVKYIAGQKSQKYKSDLVDNDNEWKNDIGLELYYIGNEFEEPAEPEHKST